MAHHFPRSLFDLAACLDDLPGLGPRTAERLAIYLLRSGPQKLEEFARAIMNIKDELRLCAQCNNITAGSLCAICSDQNRDQSTVCVVSDIMDLMAIEDSGAYAGVYHVLNGSINPIEGATPKEVHTDALFNRLDKANPKVTEIILGFDTDTKGETTGLYLIGKLRGKGITVSRLGRGLPTGSDLEYADAQTVKAALEGRKAAP